MVDGSVMAARGPRPMRRRTSRRRKLLTRSVPVVVIAAASFAGGMLLAEGPGRAERKMVTRYVTAWEHGDVRAMYAQLDAGSRATTTETAFARQIRSTAATATETAVQVLHVGSTHGHDVQVQTAVTTRLWGTLHLMLALPVTGSGSQARIHLQSSMLFPGLLPGESLNRTTKMPARATILAADGTPLAEGPERTGDLSPDVAANIVGTLAAIPADERMGYRALGYPGNARIGDDGLEAIFEKRLAGTPGGTLYAGTRVLATAKPIAGRTTKTTIVPSIENAAVQATGGKYAGITAMNPKTGAVEGLAGVAYSSLQPPGSTMKIITAVAALQAHLDTLDTYFNYASSTTIDGYTINNDDNEECGGTFLYAFAQSCDPVFADVGVKVGAKRLLATAEKFGFNQKPSIPGAAEPSIPGSSLADDLDVGSSAIGQGKVLSTSLEQADVAATIADGGRRPIPNLLAGAKPRFVRVCSKEIAQEMQQMMVAVVTEGTGTSAAIDGVQVAGKTGTAELRATTTANNPKDTDSWFVGYAPAPGAKVVAAALFPASGYGATTAAPAVRDVLEAGLGIS